MIKDSETEVFKKFKYNTSYIISADYYLYSLIKKEISDVEIIVNNTAIVKTYPIGFSQKNYIKYLKELYKINKINEGICISILILICRIFTLLIKISFNFIFPKIMVDYSRIMRINYNKFKSKL
jgi:hypothetical protein